MRPPASELAATKPTSVDEFTSKGERTTVSFEETSAACANIRVAAAMASQELRPGRLVLGSMECDGVELDSFGSGGGLGARSVGAARLIVNAPVFSSSTATSAVFSNMCIIASR